MRKINSLLNRVKKSKRGLCRLLNIAIEIVRLFTPRSNDDAATDCYSDNTESCANSSSDSSEKKSS